MKTFFAIFTALTLFVSINASAQAGMSGLNGVATSQEASQAIVHKTGGKRKRYIASLLQGTAVANGRASRRNKGRFGSRRFSLGSLSAGTAARAANRRLRSLQAHPVRFHD
jgi:hypothetical protein